LGELVGTQSNPKIEAVMESHPNVAKDATLGWGWGTRAGLLAE